MDMKTKITMIALMMCSTIIIFMISCENKNHEKLDSNPSDIELQIEAEHIADSLINDAINKSIRPKNTVSLDSMKRSIQIIKYYTSEPNSAGGVDCNIIWKNLSVKTVKYARFTVAPYNEVNDQVKGDLDYSGNGEKTVEVTGPVKSNQVNGNGTYWDCLWYNWTIDYMLITGIEIEYLDGTTISTSDINIIEQLGYVRPQNNN